MSIAQNLLNEFDNEMANTRKTLERIPEDKLGYKPDPKSMSLGRLAGHITEMVNWGTVAVTTDELDLNPATYPSLTATSRAQILGEFDKNVSESRASLAAATDQKMLGEWKLKVNGQTMMAMPRIAVVRVMVMNHIIHHRAQLTVYFRLNGIPVPALYGPSADEGMPLAADASA